MINDGKSNQLSDSLDMLKWTPLGSYLVTFHAKGLIFHGGNDFQECGRLPHMGVRAVEFSSNERYAITWNGQSGLTNREAVCVWEVQSNQLLRKFPFTEAQWPSFAFSADEQFLASKGTNGIGMYVNMMMIAMMIIAMMMMMMISFSLPTMQMVQKSCFGISNIKDFKWSPKGSVLAYLIPENNGKPATVVLLDVMTDRRVQSASFTNVEDVCSDDDCQ